jgi:hypothetical protein
MTRELFFDDDHVALFESEDELAAHVGRYPDEHRQRFTSIRAKRFYVVCRGNTIGTAASVDEGEKTIDRLATELAPREVWELFDTETGETHAFPPTEVPSA